MKPTSLLKAAAVLLLSLTLISCTSAAQHQQIAAGERLGRTAAQITLERQPDACGKAWPDLPARVGEDMSTIARRYVEYVRGPINDRQANCYRFNENQRAGLMNSQKAAP